MARDAAAKAERVAEQNAALMAQLTAHIVECGRSWERLEAALIAADQKRADDMREWRVSLGSRLDRQDHIQWGALGTLVLLLVSVIGFFLSHLPLFH